MVKSIYFFNVVSLNEMKANALNFRILKSDQNPDIFCSLIKGSGTRNEIQSAREFFWTKLLLHFTNDLKYLTIDQIDGLKKFIHNGLIRNYPVKVDYSDGRLLVLPTEYRPFITTIKSFSPKTTPVKMDDNHDLKTTVLIFSGAVLFYRALKCL
jgi:hypothetical protein